MSSSAPSSEVKATQPIPTGRGPGDYSSRLTIQNSLDRPLILRPKNGYGATTGSWAPAALPPKEIPKGTTTEELKILDEKLAGSAGWVVYLADVGRPVPIEITIEIACPVFSSNTINVKTSWPGAFDIRANINTSGNPAKGHVNIQWRPVP